MGEFVRIKMLALLTFLAVITMSTSAVFGAAIFSGAWKLNINKSTFDPGGFPHGDDQWISAAATNWATMALIPASHN